MYLSTQVRCRIQLWYLPIYELYIYFFNFTTILENDYNFEAVLYDKINRGGLMSTEH